MSLVARHLQPRSNLSDTSQLHKLPDSHLLAFSVGLGSIGYLYRQA